MASVEARITGVEQDASTGWYRITTDDERVRRLDTKVAEKAREAAELKKSGDLARIEFSEKQGNTNPHTGQPYLNRYYERAGSIETPREADDDDGITIVKPTRPATDPAEAWRICLAASAKLALDTYPPEVRGEPGAFEVQKKIAVAWARFLYFSRPPEAGFDDLVASEQSMTVTAPADDEIPF